MSLACLGHESPEMPNEREEFMANQYSQAILGLPAQEIERNLKSYSVYEV